MGYGTGSKILCRGLPKGVLFKKMLKNVLHFFFVCVLELLFDMLYIVICTVVYSYVISPIRPLGYIWATCVGHLGDFMLNVM
jgi:hypothetical protein